MRVIFSATNPCHMFEMARALGEKVEVVYYSGYPEQKLGDRGSMQVVHYSGRTLVTYGLLKLPRFLQWIPRDRLFRWQDNGFDCAVARHLERENGGSGRRERGENWVIGLVGQCRETFRRAKALGMRTVLSHAMGPSELLREVMEPEHKKAGVVMDYPQLHSDYQKREQEEWALADFHWVASMIVRDQLVQCGVQREKIWVVPYGADPHLFPKRIDLNIKREKKICFAGTLCLRKGIALLLQALEQVHDKESKNWRLDCYGEFLPEVEQDVQQYRGEIAIHRHGVVSRKKLGEALGQGTVLVLPSVEEGFGLVVVQALQSGTPCIVSDRVGAKDLIEHRKNGSIVPFGNVEALVEEIRWWMEQKTRVEGDYGWEKPATQLFNNLKGGV